MHVVQHLDESSWRTFVDDHPLGNIFHTPEMYQVLAGTKGYKPTLWATIANDGQVLALFTPVNITLFGGPLRHVTTRAVAYGSVLAPPGPEGDEALCTLLQAYNRNVDQSVMFTELRNLSNLDAMQSTLAQCGFEYEEHINYLIDLEAPEDDILRNIKKRTRSYIRRADRSEELAVRPASTPDELAASYELLCKTYENAQVPLADYSLFQAIYDVLVPLGLARFTLVYRNETPIATSIDLLYKDVIYYWYGGMDREYSSHHPNEYLRWQILRWGKKNGYGLFDFGGAGHPDEEYSVRDFKAKFGGELVSHGRNTFVHRPHLLRLSALAYDVYRRVA